MIAGRLFILFFISMMPLFSSAQLTLGDGRNQLQISGFVCTYYNYRFYKPEHTNLRKNRFKVKDAVLNLDGRIQNKVEYRIQVDFANFESDFDPENPAIRAAYFMYKMDLFDISVGYHKVPYSLGSLIPFAYSPYFQRAELVRGDLFGRRDIGLTLSREFLQNRLNVFAGAYTGLGEVGLRGDNDRSGNLEYLGRVEFSLPGKMRYRAFDHIASVKPQLMIGANARYAAKAVTTGQDYQLKTIDGEKLTYGMDVNLWFKGFSAQFEIHQMRVSPNDTTRFFEQDNPGYFLAGGYYGQLNYFHKPWQTGISARFEELNLNNYYAGINRRLSFGLVYLIDGWHSAIRLQYTAVLEEEQNPFFPEAVVNELNWEAQLRLGWQLRF